MEGGILSLKAWESFYVIIGSSAGALTGLQFVVIALVAGSRRRATGHEIKAFATPTIVHFCSALFVSAALSAPWRSFKGPVLALAACGLIGVGYGIAVARRASHQAGYRPVFEDWLWHVALPVLAYMSFITAAGMVSNWTIPALFLSGAAALLLVYIGIHNAWDAVVYVTLTDKKE
jgi:hypothetical protein